MLLFTLGCGGAATDPVSPGAQPADPPAGSSTSSSSSSSSTSSSSSSDTGTQGSATPSQTGSSSSTSSIPAGVPGSAVVDAAVQALPNWQWCTAKLDGKPCASGLGKASSSLTQDQQTPSLSGKASQFTLGGKTAYSNALWWKSFGPNRQPTHFVYDLYFYMDDPNSPEALEFDMNQSFGGVRYTWGTECSYRNTGHWDIWNPEAERWETTSVSCPVVSANTWHHLTWTVERVNDQVHYISVALDDHVSKVEKYYNPQPNYRGSELNVAFQMDGDYRQDPYSVWLDKVSLWSW